MTVVIESGATDVDGICILHSNRFDIGTLTYSSETTGFEAANALADETWNSWKPASVPATITIEKFSPSSADCCGISAHNMGSTGASFKVQYSSDGVTWNDATSLISPLTDATIMVFFPEVLSGWFRLRIVDAVCNIGNFKVSKKLAFGTGVISGHKPIHHSQVIDMLSNKSQTGHLLGNRVIRRGAVASVDAGLVDRAFAENDLANFEANYNSGRSFYYCGSPSETPLDMGYCWRPNGGDVMNITWEEGDALAQVDFGVEVYVTA